MTEWERDEVREELFREAYWIKPVIHIQYEMNKDQTFKTFFLKFNFDDREWILQEFYKDNTNMTDYCTLAGSDLQYKRFVDAELEMVKRMKNG